MHRHLIALVSVAAFAALVQPPVAAGESTPALDFQLSLGSRQPASATALNLHVLYKNPADPSAKPSPVTEAVIQAPAGTAFDGHAISVCSASDTELMLLGPDACPAGSEVGTGTLSMLTGCGAPVDPLLFDVTLLNGGGDIIQVVSDQHTGVRVDVSHAALTAPNTLTETPAPEPGCPPDFQSAIREVDFHFDQRTGPAGKAFITTPANCPASGLWSSQIAATVADGHTYTAVSVTPCTRPTARWPAISIKITPQRVTAGRTTRIRIRLSSPIAACIRGAIIHIGDLYTRTNRRGQAVMHVRPRRAGHYPVIARPRGCRDVRTRLIVAAPHA